MRALLFVCLAGCTGRVETDTADTDGSSCASRTVADCEADAACTTIDGGEISWADTGGACFDVGNREPVRCGDRDRACDDALTYAEDPASPGCREFSDSCVPAGWVDCRDQLTTPRCE